MNLLHLIRNNFRIPDSENLEKEIYYAKATLYRLKIARAIVRKYMTWGGEFTRVDLNEIRGSYKLAMRYKKSSGKIFEEDVEMKRQFRNVMGCLEEHVGIKRLEKRNYFWE